MFPAVALAAWVSANLPVEAATPPGAPASNRWGESCPDVSAVPPPLRCTAAQAGELPDEQVRGSGTGDCIRVFGSTSGLVGRRSEPGDNSIVDGKFGLNCLARLAPPEPEDCPVTPVPPITPPIMPVRPIIPGCPTAPDRCPIAPGRWPMGLPRRNAIPARPAPRPKLPAALERLAELERLEELDELAASAKLAPASTRIAASDPTAAVRFINDVFDTCIGNLQIGLPPASQSTMFAINLLGPLPAHSGKRISKRCDPVRR